MSRRKKLAVKSMHPMELYRTAMSGCDVSLSELIDRQQSRKGLRLYPEGRDGPTDDGVVPIQLKATPSAVVARTGQPWIPIDMDEGCLSAWIVGMAECMEWLIRNVESKQGLSHKETIDWIDRIATSDFSVDFSCGESLADSVRVTLLPTGLSKWKIPVSGAIDFTKQGLDAVNTLGWKVRGTVEQLDLVNRFVDSDAGDLWEITSGS